MEENTTYQISTSVNDKILEIVVTGIIQRNALDRLRAEVITILRETKTKAILLDSRAAKGPHAISEAYYRARSVPLDVKTVPIAIVEPENMEYQSFYETTAANTNLMMKYFTDIEAARTWLKGRFEDRE